MKGNVSWNHPQKIEYGANDVTWKVTALSSPKEYETYVSRLRWICYATVMEQCQAVILHTTILDRLISAYRIGLPQYKKAGGKAPSKLDIDKELLNGVYDKRGITTNKMDAIFSKVHFDTIKLDRSLIKDLNSNSVGRSLVESIVQISHDSNSLVVAEGVEEDEQADILLQRGCHIAQGHLYERPLDAESFTKKYLSSAIA